MHFDKDTAPQFVFFDVNIPDSLKLRHVNEKELQKNWRKWPHPKGTRDLGTAWAQGGTTVALVVPSAVVPEEHNVILNPAHADFTKIQISAPQRIRFDKRLTVG